MGLEDTPDRPTYAQGYALFGKIVRHVKKHHEVPVKTLAELMITVESFNYVKEDSM